MFEPWQIRGYYGGHEIPSTTKQVDRVSVKVADCDTTMDNLGVIIDNKLSLDQHVDAICISA